ncbi:MAG: outer membrane protein transport protein [Candidatus Magnetomorum sp.]|nr:outer membrane protein transport protein [Candidatus Magnetomorum sp.]
MSYKIHHQCFIFCIIFFMFMPGNVWAESPDFPYALTTITPGPVALSLGGSSIANIYDPSAAIQNPALLVFISQPQVTLSTYSAFHKEIASIDDDHYLVSGARNVNEFHLAYCGITYPFQLFSMNMAAAISYHPRFSFERSLSLIQNDEQEMTDQRLWHLRQQGYMSALSFSYGVQIDPRWMLGVTCNFWRDDLMDNHWEQQISMNGYRQSGTLRFNEYHKKSISHEDKGINFDVGLLWKISSRLIAGAMIQTRRSNDIQTTISEQSVFDNDTTVPTILYTHPVTRWDDIQIPMTMGLGVSFSIHKHWQLLMDFRQIYWEKFHHTSPQQSTTQFISGRSDDTDENLRVHIINLGTEYRCNTSIASFDTLFRMGFSICTDRGIVHPEPDTALGFGFGLIGKQLDFNFGYQYQQYGHQEQNIITDGFLKNTVRNTVIQMSITYRFSI